ncbi:MAG: amidohydrolase family protein, partial [Actinomycetota bacterium]|nr:amidohydrolase family protein [Actinomycetota bacterium]
LDDFSQTPGGLGGVETRLPLIFTEGVLAGRLTLEKFTEVWASGPARAFGLYPQKGTIAVGSDADLVIFDPQRRATLRAFDLHSQTDCTPYEGREVAGLPLTTILRGQIVVDEGRLAVETPGGELVRRYLNG